MHVRPIVDILKSFEFLTKISFFGLLIEINTRDFFIWFCLRKARHVVMGGVTVFNSDNRISSTQFKGICDLVFENTTEEYRFKLAEQLELSGLLTYNKPEVMYS